MNKLNLQASKFINLKDRNIKEIRKSFMVSLNQENYNYLKNKKEIEGMVKDLL